MNISINVFRTLAGDEIIECTECGPLGGSTEDQEEFILDHIASHGATQGSIHVTEEE